MLGLNFAWWHCAWNNNPAYSYSVDLSNIFESFLPQLLSYPNPTDPLNGDAAALYLHKPDDYKKKVTGKREGMGTVEWKELWLREKGCGLG